MTAPIDLQPLMAFAMSVARLGAWLLLLVMLFVPLERLFGRHPRRFLSRTLWQDLGFYFVSGLVPGLLLALPLSVVAVGVHAVVPDSVQATVASWPLWQRVAVGFVIGEIGFYWGHRWAHELPWLWRFHAIHHSAEHVYFLTSARAHPIDSVFIRLCGLIPAYVLGVASPLTPDGTLVPVLIVIVATLWGFFIHADLRWRLGPLEWIVATPRFHHWHHANSERRDQNYASMLPWIDRLFGTHHLPKGSWPKAYGIDERLPPSLVGQLVHPLRPRGSATPTTDPALAET